MKCRATLILTGRYLSAPPNGFLLITLAKSDLLTTTSSVGSVTNSCRQQWE